jgi:hypothetical protein
MPARRGRERRRREGVAVDRLARPRGRDPRRGQPQPGHQARCRLSRVHHNGLRRRGRAGARLRPRGRRGRHGGGRRGGHDRGLGFGWWRRLGGLGLGGHRHRDHGAAQQRAADRQPTRGGRQRRPGATLAAQEVRDEPLRPRRPTTVRCHVHLPERAVQVTIGSPSWRLPKHLTTVGGHPATLRKRWSGRRRSTQSTVARSSRSPGRPIARAHDVHRPGDPG